MRSPSFEDKEAEISSDPFAGDNDGALERTTTSTSLESDDAIAQKQHLYVHRRRRRVQNPRTSRQERTRSRDLPRRR
jgi:hypothetical protein